MTGLATICSVFVDRHLFCFAGKFTAAAMLVILGFLDCTVWPLAMTVLIIGTLPDDSVTKHVDKTYLRTA